jgi:hypothetical protein
MAANVDQLSKSIDRLRLPTLPTYRAPIQDNTTEVQPLRLHALPTELLHNVFERLDIMGVLAMRRTCKIMARIGLHHFGSEVPLIMHKDKFRALTEIAKHPLLSSRMKSLFYVIDRLALTDYETWAKQGLKRYCGDVLTFEWMCEHVETNNDIDNFPIFQAMCADQEDIVNTGYDIDCLRKLFAGCSNIRDVTVAYGAHCDRELNASHTSYDGVLATPGKGLAWAKTGARQVLNIADTAASNGVKLDSLTLAGATYQLWDPELRSEEEFESLKGLVRPLRRLRWYIQDERDIEDIKNPDSDDPPYTDVDKYAHSEADEAFETGSIVEMLAEAANLRVLKLRLWQRGRLCGLTADLEDALGDLHFTRLYDLAIGGCDAEPQYLMSAILRHKTTLRRLSLSDIHLRDAWIDGPPGWRSALIIIAGQLPHLRKVRLRGYLSSSQSASLYFGSPGEDPWRDVVENFVLKGGASPWGDHSISDREFLPEGNTESNPWGGPSSTRRDRELPTQGKCVPSGLPEDNTESDDPILDYELDSFDAAFLKHTITHREMPAPTWIWSDEMDEFAPEALGPWAMIPGYGLKLVT